jgi:hypothetical protein
MDHLNVTLNFAISVNHNFAKKKKKLVMFNQGNYTTIKLLVVNTEIE